MADDNRIEIVARLDIPKTVSTIEKDLEEVKKRLDVNKALSIVCSLDANSLATLQNQVSEISKKLKIDIPKIEIQAGTGQSAQNIENVARSVETVTNKVLTLKKTLADLDKKLVEPFEAITDNGIINAERTLSVIQSKLSSLGTVTVKGYYNDVESADSINKIIARIEAASGEVRELNFLLDGAGKRFDYIGGSYSDKGVVKVQQDLSRLNKELANFESSHKSIESGLIEPLTTARNAIIDLESGVGSVESAQKALDNLKTVAANIGTNLKSSGASFNIFDNAVNKAQNFDNTIKELGIDINKLIFTDKKGGLVESLELAKQRLQEFKQVESEKGKGLEWSQKYGEISSLLQGITNNLKAAKKEESDLDAFNRKLDAHNQEIQKKLDLKEQEIQKAKELNEAEMGNYWQGRFEETVKAQTAENQVLKDMKKYYEDYNRAIKQDSALETHRNRIEKLSATMSVFAEKNERAIRSTQTMSSGKTFAQEWQELSNALTKGNLTSDELHHLQERFAIFGKEAEAAGLKGKTAWEKFLGTFKTFSSYITANMVFNVFKRQISSMVQEVISLDSAMTELRKVTEATEPEFNKFLETAKQSAQYLGSSVTDLVDATSTFSRLGYSLSEAQNLGEVATLYKNVGDGIDISTASESIVSTLKAFKIEAEDAIGIVDKLNEVGNNFAISSGGIGEALLRSASAMAAANNDLSQSIALITTANTIAQNPESVGTGLKTMALRLRSTKTEIEEMGEDAEGAAENVSKLREQVLALTKNKVDIQLDENTYKSSYDILLEISKVWNELNDMSRASLLEQLFGKRQANVGAAILENGELLQQVYETAESSIGSATKEQEKFAKSIQYSINSFKATYQTLASDIVDSEFVKGLVDLGSTVVKGLDFIITKTGILQGILVGFGSLAIFKTVPALITKIKTLGTSIASFSAIMNTLDGSGKGGQILTTNQLALASKNLTDRQFELVLSTKQLTEAQLTEMMTARGFTKEQIQAQIAIRNQTLASTGLATAEQGAAAATFSLSGAVKGLTAAIAANPIGAIVTAVTLLVTVFTSLKRKQEEAIVEAKRLEEERQRNLETTINELKAFENEQKSVGEITNRYVALYNTTANIADKKEELTKITDELNEKFGNEKTQIDLVNNSISENIELIRQQQSEMDKQWQRDNKSAIEEAQKFVDNNSGSMVASYEVSNELVGDNGDKYDEALKEAEFYFNRMNHLIDENDKELWKYLDTFEEITTDKFGNVVKTYGYKLKEGIDKDVVPDVLKSFRDLYEQLDKYDYMNFNFFTGIDSSETLNQAISDWDKYLEVLQKNESINNELWDNTSITLDGTVQKFNELIDAASEASQKMNATDVLPADVYTYSREIEEIRVELEELAKSSPELQERMKMAFSTIGLQAEDASESAELLKKNFFDTLDEMQKGAFTKVDKINDAITKALSGDGLKSAEAWELLNMDTSGILTPIINANGEWIIQSEQLVALKEQIIGLSREQVQADLQAAQNQLLQIERQINEQYGIIKNQQEIIAQQARGNTKPNEDNIRQLSEAKGNVGRLLEAQKKYSEEVKRDNLLLQELNGRLKTTAEQQQKIVDNLNKEVENLNKRADDLLKAQEYRIDRIVNEHQNELDALNAEKDALQDQLDVLNEQKESIEQIISDYDTVNSAIQNSIQKEIDALEDQKKATEEAYNQRIDALKAENKEREDALEYAEKLKNLENAKNNKVRVYDEARGWHYASNQDNVKQAQNELAAFENRRAIEQLEAERDSLLAVTEDVIESKEQYAKQWSEITDQIKSDADEELAAEILGADWRDKIARGDISLMQKFRTEYRNHNTALQNLTKTEIKLKQDAIAAKDAEVKAKQEQIDSWKKYKQEVQDAAKTIKEANEDYLDIVKQLDAEEPLTLENRGNAFENFKNRLTGYISEISSKKSEIDSLSESIENASATATFNIETNVADVSQEMIEFINDYRDAIVAMREALDSSSTGYGVVNSPWDAKLAEAANKLKLLGYSEGGVADYTGLAMLHGRKNAPEIIFNAHDSAKLYELVHNTPNLMASMLNQAKGKVGGASTINVSIGTIMANNPQEFTKGLDQHLDRYFQRKLTASYTSK